MNKHTPGPWEAEWSMRSERSGYKGWHVFNPEDPAEGVVCDIPDENERRDADARLIAMAPDLLAICKEILAATQDPDDIQVTIAPIIEDALQTIIARAEGGAQ